MAGRPDALSTLAALAGDHGDQTATSIPKYVGDS